LYKKYIVKKGKKIGPYYYDSVRLKNGRIKTVYLGKHPPGVKEKVTHNLVTVPQQSPLGGHDALYVGGLLVFVLVGFVVFSSGGVNWFDGRFSFSLPSFEFEGNLLTGAVVSDLLVNDTGNTTSNVTTVDGSHSKTVAKQIGLVVQESGIYELVWPDDLDLEGVKLTGSVVGGGVVNVYLEDKNTLIYSNKPPEDLAPPVVPDTPTNPLTGFFVVPSDLGERFAVVDMEGDEVPVGVDIVDDETTLIFMDALIDSMVFKGLSGTPLMYDELFVGLLPPDGVSFDRVYAVDSTFIDVVQGELFSVAVAPVLFVCPFWDSDLGLCLGDWEKEKDLIVGERYGYSFGMTSFALAEGTSDVSILPVVEESLVDNPVVEEILVEDVSPTPLTGGVVADTVDEEVITNDVPVDVVETPLEEACIDTCTTSLSTGKKMRIIIEVFDAALNLDELVFILRFPDGTEVNLADFADLIFLTPLTPPPERNLGNKNITHLLLDKLNFTNDKAPVLIIQRPLAHDPIRRGIVGRLESPELERGSNWVRECHGFVCTHDLYPNPIHVKDTDGQWKLFSDVAKVDKLDGDTFVVSLGDTVMNVTFEGAQLIKTEVRSKGNSFEWLYWYNYTSDDAVPFSKVEANKEIVQKGNAVVAGDLKISFDDAVEQGFEVIPVNVDSHTEAFVLKKNLTEENYTLGELVEIDPEISLSISEIDEDATMRMRDDNNGAVTFGTVSINTNRIRIGIEGCTGGDNSGNNDTQRSWIDWNTSSIPDNAVIEQTNLTLSVRDLDADQDEINITKMNAWGFDYSDPKNLFIDMEGPLFVSSGVLTADTGIELVLGPDANEQLQLNLTDQDKFSVGLRNDEGIDHTTSPSAVLPDCPSKDTDRLRFNSSEEENGPPVLTITYSIGAPEVTLNNPANLTLFDDVGDITLNATIVDKNDGTLTEVVIYGANESDPALSDVLAVRLGVPNGTSIEFNWTAPVIQNQPDTLMLSHFDNRSFYGEDADTVNDFSSYDNDGTVGDALFNYTEGKIGGAYEFDGGNDNITYGDIDFITKPNITVMFWIQPHDTSLFTVLDKFNSGAETGVKIVLTSNDIQLTLDADTKTYFDVYTSNTYTHVAYTYDSSNVARFYVNGNKIGDDFTGLTITDNNVDLMLGISQTSTQDFDGLIDEFVIINRTLSHTDIINHFRLDSGNYHWIVNATDGDDHNASLTNVFRLDVPTIPSVVQNAPANDSSFSGVGNIILNVTAVDTDSNENLTVEIYGLNSSAPNAVNVLYIEEHVPPNMLVHYNWTTLPFENQSGMKALYHFDNRTFAGENVTLVNDFSSESFDGEIVGSGGINLTGGVLGGAYHSDGVVDDAEITFGDVDGFIGIKRSYSMWVKPNTITGTEGIFGKHTGSDGFFISRSEDDILIHNNAVSPTISDVFERGEWSHLVIVRRENTSLDVYKNGELFFSGSLVDSSANNDDFTIGRKEDGASFNGLIDEFAIFDIALNATDVANIYELQADTYYWIANITDQSDYNESQLWQFSIGGTPSVSVGPTLAPDPSNTTDTFECTFTITDPNSGDTLGANVTFYNGTVAEVYNITVPIDESIVINATEGLQARDESWHCGVIPSDQDQNFGDQKNSSTVTVVNSPPNVPTLSEPANNNKTDDTTPNFTWVAPTDPDDDVLNYSINITCLNIGGGDCAPGDDSVQIDDIQEVNFTSSDDLDLFEDDGYYYNWTVRATDGNNNSDFAHPFNVTFFVLIDINLTNMSIDFGSVEVGTNDSTADRSPVPFLIEHFGNSLIDVNLSADGLLFSMLSGPAFNYQFRVNYTGSGDVIPYNHTSSKVDFTNVETDNITAFVDFNESYDRVSTPVFVDINISVPLDEPDGELASNLTFIAYYTGVNQT
jgi:hypothetical protein